MRLPDIDNGFIGNILDCWVEIDSVEMSSRAYFLFESRRTFTNVVLPVPDMPITIRQLFVGVCWLIRVNI